MNTTTCVYITDLFFITIIMTNRYHIHYQAEKVGLHFTDAASKVKTIFTDAKQFANTSALISHIIDAKMLENYILLPDHSDIAIVTEDKDTYISVFDFVSDSTLTQKYADIMVALNNLVNWYNQWFLQQNPKVSLLVCAQEPSLYQFDRSNQLCSGDNSGINLILPHDIKVPAKALAFEINYQFCAEPRYSHGYILMPRSSAAKTPLRQANGVGLIDASYRGAMIVKVDNLSDQPYAKAQGDSISQLAMPDLRSHWVMLRIPMLSSTVRGAGGFGSTDKTGAPNSHN